MTASLKTRAILIFGSLLLLAGCASKQSYNSPENQHDWLVHADNVSHISSWNLRAKIGIRSEEEATSFNINWTEHPDQFAIRLSGPLGQGAVSITGVEGHVTLQDGKKRQSASSLEELWAQNSNLQLPFAYLKYWIRGIPHPEGNVGVKLNEHGLAQELLQEGWKVEYLSYHDQELPLPRKFEITKADKSARLVIKSWKLEN